MAEFTFDLIENLAVLSTNPKTNWSKEANIVSWNGGAPKLDIREWDPDHERMSKGVALSEEEAKKLQAALAPRFGR